MDADFNRQADIKYEKSYVAFLDVLGFKSIVSKSTNNMSQLNKYFGAVEAVLEYIKGMQFKEDIESIVISDSIILRIPYGSSTEENIHNLRQLCIAISMLQVILAHKDIWLRGAVSSGEAFFDTNKNQVVGPAYIDAYLLEENVALYPRVIINSKIIDELNLHNTKTFVEALNTKTPNDGWDSYLLFNWNEGSDTYINQDIPLFIDYLSPVIKRQDDILDKITTNLENNIHNNIHVYKKYRWVVDYMRSSTSIHLRNGVNISDEWMQRLEYI